VEYLILVVQFITGLGADAGVFILGSKVNTFMAEVIGAVAIWSVIVGSFKLGIKILVGRI